MQAENRGTEFQWDPPKRRSPFVAMGALTTAAVLMGGLVAFKKGNKALSQTMMRARIIAQGGTVAIMLATSGFMAAQTVTAESK
ncbi:hypothetical protein Ndes2526B_g01100 [Nannochloris sp. 'desiccata']|nr:hypothetical protein KSW81_002084 [Chlorella desiccata (nom. nud.)]KAG7671120.1 hypothetical protein KSW81_004544 [Chlorella desiccata (nom. nud.)]KAH7623852.1 putative RING-H2 finger protein ATL48 [Chlorella desiccata (nom. nud.)]